MTNILEGALFYAVTYCLRIGNSIISHESMLTSMKNGYQEPGALYCYHYFGSPRFFELVSAASGRGSSGESGGGVRHRAARARDSGQRHEPAAGAADGADGAAREGPSKKRKPPSFMMQITLQNWVKGMIHC